MDEKEAIRALAGLITAANANTANHAGQLMVLTAAVYALIRGQPDPEAFPRAFRSAWTELGQWHASSEESEELLAGISAALAMVEGACRVPLHVRAPSAASPPDD
ncbi:hypothetical protein [Thermomonas sp.]|uniref:hypothetical protein n=1 Tax=Thermomonas sp. TaxID=1971895 RepID=UPI002631C60A|nr:hypothetical protein [Thermomonas sp.]HRO88345.1 hypothetical protein [Chiayiivirga sp.]